MAPTRRPALRVGVVVDGAIVTDRVFESPTPITIGTSPRCTLCLDAAVFSEESLVLLRPGRRRDDGWTLHTVEGMSGRLRTRGGSVRVSGARAVPLRGEFRGKLTLDAVTVLFQSVEVPAGAVLTPLEELDFSPRWVEEDDPVFHGFLGVWTALAALMVVWVVNAPPRQSNAMEEIPDRIAHVLRLPPPVEDVTPEVAEAPEDPEAPAQDAPGGARRAGALRRALARRRARPGACVPE